MARALRRKASSATALALLACGGFAGAAFGDGLPIGSLTTSIIPTIGATTAVSTPTVSTPSVTVPPVTVPAVTVPAVTTPAVTTPPVTAPPVTTPAVTTPAATTPAATTPPVSTPKVAVPPVSVSATVPVKPASTPIAATVSTPAASVSVSASALPAASAPTVDVHAAVPTTAVSAAVGSNGASASASATVAAPALPTAGGRATTGVTPVVVSVSAAPAAVHGAPLRAIAPRLRLRSSSVLPLRPAPASILPRLVPLANVTLPAATVGAVPELQPVTTRPTPSGSVWSTVAKNPGAAAGGIAALLTLAGLGIAGAARSSAFAAACAELARFPFPRFRVLPCPDLRAPAGASGVAAGSSAAGPAAVNDATTPSRRVRGGSVPPFPPLPRIGGVLGASVTKTPWTIFKAIVVAMLAVVNAVVLGIRWRVGRLQSR